jgi:23S rRNA pseudouridine1911/1915/1917 synthase
MNSIVSADSTVSNGDDDFGVEIVYEDEYIVVVNKPAGIASEPSRSWVGENVIDQLGKRILDGGLVSRLDVTTSGLMLVPKTLEATQAFKPLFQRRAITKTYLGTVQGHLSPKEAVIDAPIGRRKGKDVRFGIVSGGRSAITEYRVLESFRVLNWSDLNLSDPNSSSIAPSNQLASKNSTSKTSVSPLNPKLLTCDFVEIHPRTGRTHQIRVHFAALGHPIIADRLYGAKALPGLSRPFLHSADLEFEHPFLQSKISLKSQLPEDLNQFLAQLRVQTANDPRPAKS